MSEEFAPPPFRPAPEALRNRIRRELRLAPRTRNRPALRVIVPLAAAAALIAGVTGVTGIRHLQGPPSVAVVPAATPSVSPRPTPRPTTRPSETSTRPMTAAEIRSDSETCLRIDRDPGGVITRSGKLRVLHAMVQPPISNGPGLPAHRELILADDDGTFSCLDGQRAEWSDHGQEDDLRPHPDAAARQDPAGYGSVTSSCSDPDSAVVQTQVLLQVPDERATSVRVKINSARQPMTDPVVVPVRKGWVYATIAITGPAASAAPSITVEVLDEQGDRLPIQPYQPGTKRVVKALPLPIEPC